MLSKKVSNRKQRVMKDRAALQDEELWARHTDGKPMTHCIFQQLPFLGSTLSICEYQSKVWSQHDRILGKTYLECVEVLQNRSKSISNYVVRFFMLDHFPDGFKGVCPDVIDEYF